MNRLAHEQSPYLLQHKDNPVDWYPWGEAAFEKARREDKPIFLSIGYATCHWCHVMEHESFEDEEVARLMNEAFVPIKVDREERPDVDSIYMTVCQMMTGQGGWPLTVLMTPEQQPFYAATYLPKHGRFGRIGMMELVPRIEAVWQSEREKVLASADHLTGLLRQANQHRADAGVLEEATIENAYGQLHERFDREHGGFGTAPKFPAPHNLLFLLRYGKRTGEASALRMVEQTLRAMRLGGVYDHVGYGFHRYSTDREWRLPHFEKMLYDQAMLAMAYTEAFQVTGNAAYRETADEVFTYVLRDMTAPEGGFYSAEDADSEGREGAFYVWTSAELRDVLGDEEAALVADVYNVEEEGNFEEEATREKTGENVLFLRKPVAEIAREKGLGEAELRERLEAARETLFRHREARVHPGKDDKVLTDWNGLMIAALAKAAAAFQTSGYAEAARRAARFVLEQLRAEDGRLLHRYRNGHAGIAAHLDDYAFLAWGLLELYEATFEPEWLAEAARLAEEMQQRFWDEEHGGFYLTDVHGENLIVRPKEIYDGAIPSGNAAALLVLLRLGRLTGEAHWEAAAAALLRWAAAQVRQHPSGFTALLCGLDFALGPTYEVVVVGERGAADTEAMLRALQTRYLPSKVLLFRPAGEDEPDVAEIAPFVRSQHALDGKATAYVCQNYQCQAPTSDLGEMLAALGIEEGVHD